MRRLSSVELSDGAVDSAVRMLMSTADVDENRAREMLADQARRAKISLSRHARAITSRVSPKTGKPSEEKSALAVDLVAAAWETEPADHRAHISDLASALTRAGHQVTLHLRRTSTGPPDSELARSGFRVVRVPAGPPTALSKPDLLPHLDEFASALDGEWAEHAPDVVHPHSWLSGLAVHGSHTPVAQSFHGLEPVDTSASRLVELERQTALAADHLIAASGDEVAELSRTGVPRARMSLVPWGVDTGAFNPDGPIAPRDGAPRVLALGEVVRHSGFDAVIEALTTVRDAELLIVGPIRSRIPREDPEVVRLVRLARDRDVAHRVRFTGQVNRADLPSLLRSADVALRVPTRDPSGIDALRAMACGVPVITTAVGALTDIVINDVTGVLLPPRDTGSLGLALRELLADPVRREICAITSVDRARERYSWDRLVAEVVDAYRKASSAPRP